jgi:hypothetical protein
MENKRFESFALVELFGHQRMAGKVSEQTIGASTFIRIDVPETKKQPAFTRILNPSAIYAINPITKEVMISLAEGFKSTPVLEWDIRDVVAKERLLLQEESNKAASKFFEDDDNEQNTF